MSDKITKYVGLVGWVSWITYLLFVVLFYSPRLQGHDTEHFLHWASVNFEYGSSPIGLSIISPFQGLGGQAQPIGVWINPAYIIPHLLGYGDSRSIGPIVCMICLGLATFFLGCAVGLPNWIAILSAQLISTLSFSPMWIWSSPVTHLNVFLYQIVWGASIPVSLGITMVAVYCYLGRLSLAGNISCLFLMPLLLVYSILCDPLYTGMFFLTLGFFLVGIFFGDSGGKRAFLWRLGGGLACLTIIFFLNLIGFYQGLFGYAARATFPNELYVEIQQWDSLTALIFQGFLSAVAVIALIISSIVVLVFSRGLVRGLAASVLIFLGFMIGMTLVYIYSGIRWNLPLPYYWELPAHPVYMVIGLLGMWIGVQRLQPWIKDKMINYRADNAYHIIKNLICLGSVLLLPLLGIISIFVLPSQPDRYPGGLKPLKNIDRSVADSKLKGIVLLLEKELSIGKDGLFRGSVVNLIGVPGGTLMSCLNIPEEAPFEKKYIDFLDNYQRTYDPHLTLSGLWDLRIPTLEDNNQLVTPPFHFLVSRTLSRPQDYHSRNWALVTLARPSLMAALGTRFLLSDKLQTDPKLTLRAGQANNDGLIIYIYEIHNPNLGDYSSTRTIVADNASKMVALMKDSDFKFENVAIVEKDLGSFNHTTKAMMFYEKGGVRVQAESNGRSLLVLPVQFSNSLQIIETKLNSKQVPIEFHRVNLLETGLVFEGQIDIKFAHIFGPFRGVSGRLQDIEDCRRLGIQETGEIPYPPGYQPLSFKWIRNK